VHACDVSHPFRGSGVLIDCDLSSMGEIKGRQIKAVLVKMKTFLYQASTDMNKTKCKQKKRQEA